VLDRTIPITDHRGHPFTLWSGALIPTTNSESQADARHARRIVWQNIDLATRRRIRWTLFGASVFIIFGLLDQFVFHQTRAFFPYVYVIAMAFTVWTTWRTSIMARSAAICTDLLRRGLCPACGYKLEGLDPDANGFTTCPECSAAWKTPPP